MCDKPVDKKSDAASTAEEGEFDAKQ